MITQNKLKELLRYNPETGEFIWKVDAKANKVKGKIAGRTNNRGYIQIGIMKKSIYAHRLAFLYITGHFPESYVDHENGIKDDNRFSNLRCVTPKGNNLNRKIPKSNKSGIIGVYFVNRTNKWRAVIQVDKKTYNLGEYADKELAILKRKEAEIEYGFHKNHGKRN